VNEITLVNRGFGYLSPTITISAPNEGSNTATATANVINDFIVGINITSAGSGYTSDPTITISSPDNVTINYANVNIDDDWDYVVVIEDA
jgi:hypothetical protein